jgi:hypothetical protein
MTEINFNKLAWDAPKHGEVYGYIPTDKYYSEIIEWLKTGTKRYVTKGAKVTTTRLSMPNSEYDVVVEYTHETKMISWIFRQANTFEI